MFAARRSVEILIENTPNHFSNAARLNDFLGITHLRLNYCFDVGHAHMGSGIPGEFEAMKDRIRSTHIHDNDGSDDSHLFPLERKGQIEWMSVMKLLALAATNIRLCWSCASRRALNSLCVAPKKSLTTWKN